MVEEIHVVVLSWLGAGFPASFYQPPDFVMLSANGHHPNL
jgi:hypothetical protein